MTPDLDHTPARDDAAAEVASGTWCSLHSRAVTRWRFDLAGTGALVVLVLITAEVVLRNAGIAEVGPRGLIPGSTALIILVLGWFWPPVAYRHWRYRLADDALEIKRGVIVQQWSAVPYRRVQQVDLSRGPIDRMLGLTSADLTTAAATSDGSIPALAPDVAEAFRRIVLERAGRDDAV